MAATALETLRRLVDEPDETTYSDQDLSDRLAATGATVNTAALAVWKEKLVATTGFVDVSEGGSSRRMSQAYDHAKEMVAFFKEEVRLEGGAPIIRRLVRTTA